MNWTERRADSQICARSTLDCGRSSPLPASTAFAFAAAIPKLSIKPCFWRALCNRRFFSDLNVEDVVTRFGG